VIIPDELKSEFKAWNIPFEELGIEMACRCLESARISDPLGLVAKQRRCAQEVAFYEAEAAANRKAEENKNQPTHE
jgi:hypothetical protein